MRETKPTTAMTVAEQLARMDEVERALNQMCSECAKGNARRPVPHKGGLHHRIYHMVRSRSGWESERAYWTTCGRDNWDGRYLEERLEELAFAPLKKEVPDAHP